MPRRPTSASGSRPQPRPAPSGAAVSRTAATQPVTAPSVRAWLALGLAAWALYVYATFDRHGPMWGLHSLGYFSVPVRILVLAATLSLLLPPVQRGALAAARWLLDPLLRPGVPGLVAALVLGILALFTLYVFRIQTGIYGDSVNIVFWNDDNSRFRWEWFAPVLDWRVMGGKEALTNALHRTVAHLFAVPIFEAYYRVSAVAGAICLGLWLRFVSRTAPDRGWGAVLVVAGLCLGANQIFFGHVESYPFAFLTSLAFLLVGFLAFDRPAWTPWAIPLFLLAFKSHPAGILWLPSLLVLLAWRWGWQRPAVRRWLAWRPITLWLFVPSLLLGVALYLFVFKSWNEPYAAVGRQFAHTFLPVVPARPPLDRYTMQSPAHLLDFGNVLLLVGTPALLAVLGIAAFHARAVDWGHPRVLFCGLALLYALLFYFAVNPELSMPRDWDLYTLLGAPLLVALAALVVHAAPQRLPVASVFGVVAAFAPFSLGFYAVNASWLRLSYRIEDLGVHAYRTYYAGSSYMVTSAEHMESDPDIALERQTAAFDRIRPRGLPIDLEYGHLARNVALLYAQRQDYDNAIVWLERVRKANPTDSSAATDLARLYLATGRSAKALPYIDELLRARPRNLEMLKAGVIASSQESDLARASDYLRRARQVAPADPDVVRWSEQLASGGIASPGRSTPAPASIHEDPGSGGSP